MTTLNQCPLFCPQGSSHMQLVFSMSKAISKHARENSQCLYVGPNKNRMLPVGCQIENECFDSYGKCVVAEQCSQLDFNCQCIVQS